MSNTDIPSLPKRTLHPMLWVAALSVTAFSMVGIAAITGTLPGSHANTPADTATPPAVPLAATPAPSTTATPVTPTVIPVKPAAKPVVEQRTQTVYSSKPRRADDDFDDGYGNDTRRSQRVYTSQNDTVYERPQPPQTCRNCGMIESVNVITEKGEGSGLGAIAGGVVGGILGNQIGKGGGRDLARIAGIAGGAYAGHEIEKSQRGRTTYEVNVRLEDGSLRTFRQETPPQWQAGDRVKLEDGTLVRRY